MNLNHHIVLHRKYLFLWWAQTSFGSGDPSGLSNTFACSLRPVARASGGGILQLFTRLSSPPGDWIGLAEAPCRVGRMRNCKVRDPLKQDGLNKSPGLDGLQYEIYLRLSHMLVSIILVWAITGYFTKVVITLLKKSSRDVWKSLGDYITLLNTELKILARVLANFCELLLVIWSERSRITLWKEDRSKTICIWSVRF